MKRFAFIFVLAVPFCKAADDDGDRRNTKHRLILVVVPSPCFKKQVLKVHTQNPTYGPAEIAKKLYKKKYGERVSMHLAEREISKLLKEGKIERIPGGVHPAGAPKLQKPALEEQADTDTDFEISPIVATAKQHALYMSHHKEQTDSDTDSTDFTDPTDSEEEIQIGEEL